MNKIAPAMALIDVTKSIEGSLEHLRQRLSALKDFECERQISGMNSVLDSRRVFHGRGKCYDGLESVVVDVFYPVIALTLFQPLGDALESKLEEMVKACVSSAHGVSAAIIQRRYQSHLSTTPGGITQIQFELLAGALPGSLYARRGGLRFGLNLNQQNIGFFLDIEPARQWLAKQAKHANILNLFSYTCTFSVLAIAEGARAVLNMDLSSRSLAQGRENHRLNNLSLDNVSFFANDIFKSWSRIKRFAPYEVAILDPPSFQKGSFIASKDYAKVLRRMSALLAPGGQVLACLNSPEVKAEEFKHLLECELEGFSFVEQLKNHSDFPDSDAQRALKMFVFKRA